MIPRDVHVYVMCGAYVCACARSFELHLMTMMFAETSAALLLRGLSLADLSRAIESDRTRRDQIRSILNKSMRDARERVLYL